MAWVRRVIRSSQQRFFLPPHCALLKSPFVSTMWMSLVAIILSNNLTKHEVRLIGLYEEISDAGLPVFSKGMKAVEIDKLLLCFEIVLFMMSCQIIRFFVCRKLPQPNRFDSVLCILLFRSNSVQDN